MTRPHPAGRRALLRAGTGLAAASGTRIGRILAGSASPRLPALPVAAAGAVAVTGATTPGARARTRQAAAPFAFALIGDLPYSEGGEDDLAAMLARIDEEPLAFVLHVGDIKGSAEPCSDALYARRHALLDRSAHPLVLLPGDNEWTDCHGWTAGGHDPPERLAALRRLFWSTPEPLGRAPRAANEALGMERQPQAPENVRWQIGAVHFAALHVVGSNNGLGEYPGSEAEFEARQALNRAWLDAWLARALRERADALVLAVHANPGFGSSRRSGLRAFAGWLQDLAAAFPGPVLFLHGDTHRFRVDRPLLGRDGRIAANFTRVECFGFPFTASWVRIGYDPAVPDRFVVGTREIRAAPP
jgi:hypothetical protein